MKTISKWITGVLILATFNSSFSQRLHDRIQGDWICVSVTDSAGNKIASEFGEADRYLRFSFQGKYLHIAQAPFDRGINFPFHYGQDFIDPTFERLWDMPDLFYRVISLDSSKLILKATFDKKQYLFINQHQFIPNPKVQHFSPNVIVVIVSKGGMERTVNYKMNNIDQENLYPSPRFKDDRYSNLGNYLLSYFHFPQALQSDTLSYQCVAEFDVGKKGIQNLKIVQGLNYGFNAAVFDVIWLTRRNWTPIILKGQNVVTSMRFKFVYFNMPIPREFNH